MNDFFNFLPRIKKINPTENFPCIFVSRFYYIRLLLILLKKYKFVCLKNSLFIEIKSVLINQKYKQTIYAKFIL